MSLITGQGSIVYKGAREEKTKRDGISFIHVWQGHELALRAKRDEVLSEDAEWTSLVPASMGGIWELQARFNRDLSDPAAEAPTVQFRSDPARTRKLVTEPPLLTETLVSSLDQEDLRELRAAIAASRPPAFTGTTQTQAALVYDLVITDHAFRVFFQPVVQMVRTASAVFSWPDQSAQVGRIYTATAVVNEMQSVSGAQPNWTLQQDTYPGGGTPPMAYGYLKHAPHYDTTVRGQTRESLMWEYGLWPTTLYGAVIT